MDGHLIDNVTLHRARALPVKRAAALCAYSPCKLLLNVRKRVSSFRRSSAAGLALALSLVPIIATAQARSTKVGAAAPALHLSELLQAPKGSELRWSALRGKVVVIEFWATWCMPCVANIPHFNELATTYHSSKAVFLSVDDERPEIVKAFLSKRPIAGWIGIDTTGQVFKDFGVAARPLAVIVDSHGRVAAVTTRPDLLKAADIDAVANGRTVVMKVPRVTSLLDAPFPSSGVNDTLFELSITKAEPGAKPDMEWSSSGDLAMLSATADQLLAYAFDIPRDRVAYTPSLPAATYNVHARFGNADPPSRRLMLQDAAKSALHLSTHYESERRKVLVMKLTDRGASQLTARKSTEVMPKGLIHGYNFKLHKIHIENGELEILGQDIENFLGEPVINETGLAGTFDLDASVNTNDVEGFRRALLQNWAIDLVEDTRSIPILEVVPEPSGRSLR